MLPLYAQGHSLSVYLIGQHGKRTFMAFLADGMQDENWRRAVQAHYGFENLLTMQNQWNDWVKQGRPQLAPASSAMGQLASNTRRAAGGTNIAASQGVLRIQSPDPVTPKAITAPAAGASGSASAGR